MFFSKSIASTYRFVIISSIFAQTLFKSEQQTSMTSIPSFIDELGNSPPGPFFNPWHQQDPDHDLSAEAPQIRWRQLETYLQERIGRARWLFVAEALGYQGGHFTGIAMTSERILLGHQKQKYGVAPEHVFRTMQPERTSNPELNRKGMTEPTATIMWGAISDLELDPYQVVLWNALPWHPYSPDRGLLSNRTPTPLEMAYGTPLLKQFLSLFDQASVIAVGRKCEELLREIRVDHHAVRHPANGGAPKFRHQLKSLMRKRG